MSRPRQLRASLQQPRVFPSFPSYFRAPLLSCTRALSLLAPDLHLVVFAMLRAITLFGALLIGALPAYAVKYSVTILQPPGYTYTTALGNSASNQVGYGALPGASNHALLWSGTAASTVDLTPVGYSASNAFAITGSREVGDAT